MGGSLYSQESDWSSSKSFGNLHYRFEQQPDGSVLVWEPNSKTVYKAVRLFVRGIDDDVVMEIKEKDLLVKFPYENLPKSRQSNPSTHSAFRVIT